MHIIMTDSKHKCENYMDARKNMRGFHEIKLAEPNSDVWRIKSATRGGNKPVSVLRVNKKGKTVGSAGYIDRFGFNPHT